MQRREFGNVAIVGLERVHFHTLARVYVHKRHNMYVHLYCDSIYVYVIVCVCVCSCLHVVVHECTT